jgi:hypothetical protein
MEKSEHDGKTKQQIKDTLYGFIYGPVQKSFKTRIDTLIARNTLMGGYGHKHFSYKGVVYNGETTHPPLKKNRLLASLRPEMDEYLSDLERLNNTELPYVLGFINQVLNSSCDFGDYLKILPEALHPPLLKLSATFPCKNSRLDPDRAKAIVDSNAGSIALVKERLVLNLLI